MKKNIKLALVILVIAILFTVTFSGCSHSSDPTYAVWTDTMTYNDFTSTFPSITLNDGYYVRVELADSDWNTISPSLTNEGK